MHNSSKPPALAGGGCHMSTKPRNADMFPLIRARRRHIAEHVSTKPYFVDIRGKVST